MNDRIVDVFPPHFMRALQAVFRKEPKNMCASKEMHEWEAIITSTVKEQNRILKK